MTPQSTLDQETFESIKSLNFKSSKDKEFAIISSFNTNANNPNEALTNKNDFKYSQNSIITTWNHENLFGTVVTLL